MTANVKRTFQRVGGEPVVALGLVWIEGRQYKIQVIPLDGLDVEQAVATCVTDHKVTMTLGLSRLVTCEELAKYVPGLGRCPDVEWVVMFPPNSDEMFMHVREEKGGDNGGLQN